MMRGTAMVEVVVRRSVTMGSVGRWATARRLVGMAGLCAALGLTGCGHSDLKAPCEATEGALSYAEIPHDCGPMQRVNAPFDALNHASKTKTEPLR